MYHRDKPNKKKRIESHPSDFSLSFSVLESLFTYLYRAARQPGKEQRGRLQWGCRCLRDHGQHVNRRTAAARNRRRKRVYEPRPIEPAISLNLIHAAYEGHIEHGALHHCRRLSMWLLESDGAFEGEIDEPRI